MPASRCSGGNSGIGVETARALAHAGARVILTSRKVSAGEEVAASLKSAGVKASRLLKHAVYKFAGTWTLDHLD